MTYSGTFMWLKRYISFDMEGKHASTPKYVQVATILTAC